MPAVCPHAGSVQQELRLPELSKLTALHSANMSGKTIRLGGTLPPSLTYLGLEGAGKEDTMPPVSQCRDMQKQRSLSLPELQVGLPCLRPQLQLLCTAGWQQHTHVPSLMQTSILAVQVANLTGLRYLSLVDCAYTEGSMRQLSTLQLRELDLLDGTTIPPCLSALGQLACLSVNTCSRNDVATLGAALSALSSLRRLGLIAWDPAWRRLPPAITSLRKLERLCLYSSAAEVEADALPGGAWLASVQWLVSCTCISASLGTWVLISSNACTGCMRCVAFAG